MLSIRAYLTATAALAALLSVPTVVGRVDGQEAEEPTNEQLRLKACGPKEKEVNFAVHTDKANHPTPQQPADKALIYVVRPSMIGNKVQTKLAVDGDWKGANRGDNYFFFMLDPGEHYFCSQAENHSLLTLKVEAGKTYYLQQHVRMGALKARNKLEQMGDEEGAKRVSSAHLSTWESK